MKLKVLYTFMLIAILSFPLFSNELDNIAKLDLEHNKRKDIESYINDYNKKQIEIQTKISMNYRLLEKAFANRFVRQNRIIKITLDINTLKEKKLDNKIIKLKYLRRELTRDQYRKYIILEHSTKKDISTSSEID